MRRAVALFLAAGALAGALAVGSGDAAVAGTLREHVRVQVASSTGPATPTQTAAPRRSRTRTAMAVLEEAVVGRMNEIRRSRGLRPLQLNRRLQSAAIFHSRDMGRRGYFEHDSISGTPFWRRIERFYPSRGFRSWTVGENLLWGTGTYGPAFAVREWMNSPPHRQNILSREWREVGIGAAHFAQAPGEYRGRAVTIMTADFGART
jgi:uncharacterized protein YkwD